MGLFRMAKYGVTLSDKHPVCLTHNSLENIQETETETDKTDALHLIIEMKEDVWCV